MKKLALVSLLLLSACASESCKHHHRVHVKGNDQINHAKRYMNFLVEFGSAKSVNEVGKIAHPFDKNCKKMMNDKIVANSSEEFINQLTEAKKIAPNWQFSNIQIHPHLRENAATVSYNISAPGLGNFTVIKILTFTEDGNVGNVLEVFAESPKAI